MNSQLNICLSGALNPRMGRLKGETGVSPVLLRNCVELVGSWQLAVGSKINY
jgi:hypothetical protein